MPKLTIKGSLSSDPDADPPVTIQHVLLDDCQTCGAAFDITIPFDLQAKNGSVVQVHTSATTDADGKRNIKVGLT